MTMLPFGEVAPIKRRAVAYVIDALIAAIIPVIGMIIAVVMITSALAGPEPAAGVLAVTTILFPVIGLLELGWFIVYTVMQAGRGSIGMRAQGLRLADASDGGELGFGRALLRNVIWGLAAAIVVGYFSALFDGSGRFQGWHDKAAGSVMLDQRTSGPAPASRVQDSAQAPLVPADHRPDATTAAPTAMPGFGAPAAPTSMPGFGQAPGAFLPPQPGAGPAEQVVPPTPEVAAAPPAYSAPQPPVFQEPTEEEFAEHTVLSPRIQRELPDDPLISFVPGVTQEPPQQSAPPEPTPSASSAPASAPASSAPASSAPASSAPVEPVSAPTPDAAPVTAPGPVVASTPSVLQPVPAAEDDEDIESTRISVPGHRLVFTWDDGQRATVSGRTVFGRNPEESGSVTNVPVRDETRSLSKTHFEAGANAQGGWVMDRQSTNGTTIVRDGVRIACPPGQRVPVRLGDALEIGDRIVTVGGYV